MARIGTQKELALAFGTQSAPADAPTTVLRQVTSEAQALRVAMVASGHKVASIAAAIGKSASYVSRLQTGARPIPHKLVGPLCAVTGSNLLRQFIELERALNAPDDVLRLAAMLREAA